jgi:hypothetical protein
VSDQPSAKPTVPLTTGLYASLNAADSRRDSRIGDRPEAVDLPKPIHASDFDGPAVTLASADEVRSGVILPWTDDQVRHLVFVIDGQYVPFRQAIAAAFDAINLASDEDAANLADQVAQYLKIDQITV